MTQHNDPSNETLLKFPCDFTVKILGKVPGDFEKIVLAIIQEHFSNGALMDIQKKFSKDQNYLSLSVTVYATSKSQLDAFYQALTSRKEVLMVL